MNMVAVMATSQSAALIVSLPLACHATSFAMRLHAFL